ncbi:ornithine--oxo-acid transaminase [Sanguibacter gelidistatuariae]|uniref:ornithine aminotransferase n=1 Tax=Sanguibacter gelidistatuariae TaxID=1814289 RepID=A0A1G6Q3G0_9MICO|nr:ornithine--oxo-acid transaminase [Sanguibacter gelidistatuariae]SDC86474.1 ornithine--oxo-acid transaminase [Sanguibacter gelidistatuariae]
MAVPHTAARLAHNYDPLPVTITTALGSWVTDSTGREHLDFLAGYSALNFGHRHPALVEAATAQLDRVTLTSRAFGHDLLEPFADALCSLVADSLKLDGTTPMMVPMNTGAEAVETAIKAARKWGHRHGIAEPTIIVAAGNFHGRTTTIVSFSTDAEARDGYGPYTPGFRIVPFGDAQAVADAIDETTVAVLMEPIQGEAGVVVPPPGFWASLRTLCDDAGILLIADEIQSGLGRTGTTLACDLWNVRPDLVTLGKALGGGIVPVSAVVGRADVLDVFTPGTHGSTFGGNPLACAVGLAVVDLLATGEVQERARVLGDHFQTRLDDLVTDELVAEVRGAALWAGIDLQPGQGSGRDLCRALLDAGVLAKDTHGATIRLAPPLTIDAGDLDLGLDRLRSVLEERAATSDR